MYQYIKLSDVQDENILTNGIYINDVDNYYITDDWSPEMYDALAFAGFISVSIQDERGNAYLFPEMQFSYSVLHWDNLHTSKRLKDFIGQKVLTRNYGVSVNKDIEAVFDSITHYHDDNNWMIPPYLDVLRALKDSRQKYNLQLLSIELWDGEKLIGGEIGYIIGSIYTSLTGFSDRENYSNFGKVQLLSLALLLKKSGYEFWNMGHPAMDYKFNLGAIEYQRRDFLTLWTKYRDRKIECRISEKFFTCDALLDDVVTGH